LKNQYGAGAVSMFEEAGHRYDYENHRHEYHQLDQPPE
jgi:hypothetical protein